MRAGTVIPTYEASNRAGSIKKDKWPPILRVGAMGAIMDGNGTRTGMARVRGGLPEQRKRGLLRGVSLTLSPVFPDCPDHFRRRADRLDLAPGSRRGAGQRLRRHGNGVQNTTRHR